MGPPFSIAPRAHPANLAAMKAVFIASSHSTYDDRPGELYHFPNMYLSRVVQTVGDWVIFYQGRRGGQVGYNSVQRVERITPDPANPTHSYEDMSLLIARDSVTADIAARLFVPDRRLILPVDPAKAPHPAYLKWHREQCFKG